MSVLHLRVLGAAAPNFDTFANLAEPYLLPHHLHQAKVAFQSTIIEHSNWKLVWENNRECYHCAVNHPELCRTYPSTPTVVSIGMATNSPGGRETVAAVGVTRSAEPLSALAERSIAPGAYAASWRRGEFYPRRAAAVRRPFERVGDRSECGFTVDVPLPSTWNHVLGDHATTFRVLPLSPTETQLTTKWLVHKDAEEAWITIWRA